MTRTKTRSWRIIDLLDRATEHLKEKGIDSPRLNAERLLAHVLDLERVDLYLQFDRPLIPQEVHGFKEQLRRRLRREPLQYILGQVEFLGLRFRVTPAVLIPRPETEVLVEEVLGLAQRRFGSSPSIRILDVGTGSGNIAVSLARELANARVTALDISGDALGVARENASYHNAHSRVEFVQADFVDFARQAAGEGRRFEVIVSNPPYVASEELEHLDPEIRRYEPRLALVAEEDVLSCFRQLSLWAPRLLQRPGFVAVEAGYGQAASVTELFRREGFSMLEIQRDLAGIERVILAGYDSDASSTPGSTLRPKIRKEPITE